MPNPKEIWQNFFEACDLPKKVCQEYAESFVNERIQPNMLKELDKEMLKQLGIVALGDQLAVMRYVKETGGVNAPAFKQIQIKESATTSSNQGLRHVQKAKATSTSMVSRSIAIKKPQTFQPRIGGGGLRSDEILQERAATFRPQSDNYSRPDRTLVVSNRRTSGPNIVRRTQIQQEPERRTAPHIVRRTQVDPRELDRRTYSSSNIRDRVTRRPAFERREYY